MNPHVVQSKEQEMHGQGGQDQDDAIHDCLPGGKVPIQVSIDEAVTLVVLAAQHVVKSAEPEKTEKVNECVSESL